MIINLKGAEMFKPYFENISEGILKMKEKSPEVFQFLASEGWYLPFDILPRMITELGDLIDLNNLDELNQKMIDFYNQEFDFFKDLLISRFSNRAIALNQAIEAHQKEKYYLSIPVFFSQTEGICKELTGQRFFGTKKNKPHTYQWAENLNIDSILGIFIDPLKEVGITRQNQDFNNPVGINRHDVLHGESTNYGTKLNSYKAFSLLCYIGDAVYLMNQQR